MFIFYGTAQTYASVYYRSTHSNVINDVFFEDVNVDMTARSQSKINNVERKFHISNCILLGVPWVTQLCICIAYPGRIFQLASPALGVKFALHTFGWRIFAYLIQYFLRKKYYFIVDFGTLGSLEISSFPSNSITHKFYQFHILVLILSGLLQKLSSKSSSNVADYMW